MARALWAKTDPACKQLHKILIPLRKWAKSAIKNKVCKQAMGIQQSFSVIIDLDMYNPE